MKKVMPTAVLLLLLFFFAGCCDDDEVNNPCKYSTPPPERDFKMYIAMPQPIDASIVDTFYLPNDIDTLRLGDDNRIGGNVEFESSDVALDSIIWRVGSDIRTFKKAKFMIPFRDAALGIEKIDVKMLRYRRADNLCFPNDIGRDTVQKSFYIADAALYPHPQLGNFKGYIVGAEADTFTVKIAHLINRDYFVITNFPKGVSVIDPVIAPYAGAPVGFVGNYLFFLTQFAFAESNRSGLEYAIGKVKNGILTIDYRHKDGTKKRFVGVKQP